MSTHSISNPAQPTFWILAEKEHGVVLTNQSFISGRGSETFETFTVLHDFLSRLIELNIKVDTTSLNYYNVDNEQISDETKNAILASDDFY